MQYLKTIYKRYHKSTRTEKKQILNEFSKVCNYNRKYAIYLLNEPPPSDKAKLPKKREKIYGDDVINILATVWRTSEHPWSQRLKALLPIWLPWIRKHFNITTEQEKMLLLISPATIDRRLKSKKLLLKKRIYGTTRPGTLLKHHIPIKTDSWDVDIPGFLETDLVSHSGSKAEGEFIYSLNNVDIQTTWTEARAVMGKGQKMVVESFDEIKKELPFPLKGIDSDNGSEFINYHLSNFCDKNHIQFTRGRPYKKDDNAHIEQKNWTHVRKIFGYVRYDTEEALAAMNDLYRNELRWFKNFFLPSVKLVKKVRIGSKVKRIYDAPRTPLQRVCACLESDPQKVASLKQLFHSLDPFKLSHQIDKKVEQVYAMSTKISDLQKRTTKSEKKCEHVKNTQRTLETITT